MLISKNDHKISYLQGKKKHFPSGVYVVTVLNHITGKPHVLYEDVFMPALHQFISNIKI